MKLKIMSMPVFIGAFAKNFFIFFFAPVWIKELVGRVEMFYSGDVNHFPASRFHQR
jgi:hypothetical protein